MRLEGGQGRILTPPNFPYIVAIQEFPNESCWGVVCYWPWVGRKPVPLNGEAFSICPPKLFQLLNSSRSTFFIPHCYKHVTKPIENQPCSCLLIFSVLPGYIVRLET